MMEFYYGLMGCYNYDGKFRKYCNQNQITEAVINTEFLQTKYNKSMKCVLFDNNFPFCDTYDIATRTHRIFKLLSYCVAYKPSIPNNIIHGMFVVLNLRNVNN